MGSGMRECQLPAPGSFIARSRHSGRPSSSTSTLAADTYSTSRCCNASRCAGTWTGSRAGSRSGRDEIENQLRYVYGVTFMIDLELTEDHKALIETVREFAQKEVAPYIKE